MGLEYAYPQYGIDLTDEMVQECRNTAIRILEEIGLRVAHERFVSKIRNQPGITVDGDRVRFDRKLSNEYLDRFIAKQKYVEPPPPGDEWTVTTAGYSMAVIDIETEQIRPATCQDLRDLIKLVNSYGVGGSYPVMPQDLPPLMRAIACFKICWEMSENIRPFDYQMREQTRYIYEMHQVIGKPFDITLCIPTTMTLDPRDVDVFLDFYEDLKKHHDIRFAPLDYGMIGLTQPITATGCATMVLASKLALNIMFNLFDSEIDIPIGVTVGHPTDLKNACWAFGSPRTHLFNYLNSRFTARLCGQDPKRYVPPAITLQTSSAALDETAAMEKMAFGLLWAMMGARSFGYAGVLCVDDVYSGTQFVIDLEIVDYIRETIESFNPHPDIINMEQMWEECRDVCLGKEEFISHPNTLDRFRNIVPSPKRIVRQKLRAWLADRKLLKDRARQEALERIRTFEPYRLPDDKQKELDRIYARAQAELVG